MTGITLQTMQYLQDEPYYTAVNYLMPISNNKP